MCIVISSIGFGIMPVLVKSVYELGGDTISVIFYKSIFGSAMLWAFNLIAKKPIKLSKDQLKFIIMVGLIGYYPTSFALFEAYNYMHGRGSYYYPFYVSGHCNSCFLFSL